MDILMNLADHPAAALVASGVALGALVIRQLARRDEGSDDEAPPLPPGVEAHVRARRFHEAAMLCLRHDRLAEAQGYFLQANEPARAAQTAARRGDPMTAGALYEQAGELRRAAQCYERAGDTERAKALYEKAGPDPDVPQPSRADVTQPARPMALAQARSNTPPCAASVQPPPAEARRTAEVPRAVEADDLSAVEETRAVEPTPATSRPSATMIVRHVRLVGGAAPTGVLRGATLQGLAVSDVDLALLADAAVSAAGEGPSREDLQRSVGDRPCDASNVEDYYRMGLTCLACGEYEDAQKNFERVERVAPGYRDARARLDEIARWRSALGEHAQLAEDTGTRRNRYAVRGELSRSGDVVVYRATDLAQGRDVALKFVPTMALEEPARREEFLREARAVGQLDHPAVVPVYEVGSLDGRAFVAMECVEGRTLDAVIAAQGRLPVIDALRAAAQALTALDHAHQRGVVHGDVRPANLIRTADGTVRLMDFGLTRALGDAAPTAYSAPELRLGDRGDVRADLFALGVSLYVMLSGELPPRGASPSLRARFPEVPAAIDDALRTAMATDPARRFPTARAFLAPVQRVLSVIERAAEERNARLPARGDRVPTRPMADAPANPRSTAVVDDPHRFARASTRLLAGLANDPPAASPASAAQPSSRPARVDTAPFAAQPSNAPAPRTQAEPFNSRKGTLLMHAAPSSPPVRTPSAAHDTQPARRATRSLGDPARRSVSSMPPPA